MNKPRIHAGILVPVFLAGIALGAWAMRLYFNRTISAWNPTERFTERLAGDLRLEIDQRRQVASILVSQKRSMEDLRDGWRVDVRTLAREGEERIARTLKAGQMDEFMRLHDRIHGDMNRFLWTSESGPTAIASYQSNPTDP